MRTKQRDVWVEEKREIALAKQHAGHWIVANRPFLQQRDGRLEAEGVIYSLKPPYFVRCVLLLLCCFPQTQT
jgi:hypothetical protein